MTDQQTATTGQKESTTMWLSLKLAWELGYLIAIPVVVLGIGGAYLDKYMGTMPLFTLIGFVLATAGSGYSIYKRLLEINSPK
jgi:F0F1-type ATP synthase assembly protein I